MQRAWIINGENITQDKDLSNYFLSLAYVGVFEWLLVEEDIVWVWKSIIECTRTNGEKVAVSFENTEAVVIDTSWTTKVYIEVNQAKLDDWSNNSEDWTGIAEIKTGASYPSGNYTKLASVTTWDITDERTFIKHKWLNVSWSMNFDKSSNIASASSVNLATATGNGIHITWVATITSFWTLQAGAEYTLIFDWILLLTHNATSLILPTGANITTQAGDVVKMISEGSGNWKCSSYIRADWKSLVTTSVPDASETEKWIIEIANNSEAIGGIDDLKAMTSKKTKDLIDTLEGREYLWEITWTAEWSKTFNVTGWDYLFKVDYWIEVNSGANNFKMRLNAISSANYNYKNLDWSSSTNQTSVQLVPTYATYFNVWNLLIWWKWYKVFSHNWWHDVGWFISWRLTTDSSNLSSITLFPDTGTINWSAKIYRKAL